jgi:hypothetical protein
VANMALNSTGWTNHQIRMAMRGPKSIRVVMKQHMIFLLILVLLFWRQI